MITSCVLAFRLATMLISLLLFIHNPRNILVRVSFHARPDNKWKLACTVVIHELKFNGDKLR